MSLNKDVQRIIQDGDRLFSERLALLSLWQEIAYNFYPQRADFTFDRYIGYDFMSNLVTNNPIAVREELGSSISSLLRPAGTLWFRMEAENTDNDGRAWLQWAAAKMRRQMYDQSSLFVKTTKTTDHDFVTFGQGVITLDMNPLSNGLLYRNWHLKNVAWRQNINGVIDNVHHKMKMTAADMVRTFGSDKVDKKVNDMMDKEPYREINYRKVVVPAEDYPGLFQKKTDKNKPFLCLYIDIDHQHLIEKTFMRRNPYIIPRWNCLYNNQYAWSPCAVMGLADARLLQAMALTILEAGEKSSNPPMVATSEAILSEPSVYAGGITWVDAQYDERLGPALRPIQQDYRGLPNGLEIMQDIRAQLHSAFFLNKIMLPPLDPKMTAYASSEVVKEYIRQAQPIIEPIEMEYNALMCEDTFNFMMDKGFFAENPMPQSLSQAEYNFRFTSPITQAVEAQKVGQLQQLQGIIAGAMQIDPDVTALVDLKTASRDAANGIEVPATWLVGEQQMQQILQQKQQAQAAAQQMQMIHAGAQTAEQAGKAGQALGAAGMLPPEMMQQQTAQ